MTEEALALALAIRFHETYERLAPSFGYETRKETRAFDPTTPNGRLMVAVCAELLRPTGIAQAIQWDKGVHMVKGPDGNWHEIHPTGVSAEYARWQHNIPDTQRQGWSWSQMKFIAFVGGWNAHRCRASAHNVQPGVPPTKEHAE